MIWLLAIDMAERLSMVATAAFVLSRTGAFGRYLNRELTRRDRLVLAVLLGIMGIAGTYAGIPVDGALANSRVVGIMVAGLLGGPWVGVGAGLIAGVHRYMLGGFTALACALAAVAEGFLGGMVQRSRKDGQVSWPMALAAGAAAEVLQMLIILLIARPLHDAWELVRVISLPMIVVNSAGAAIFILVVRTGAEFRERIAAGQAQQTLRIAAQTLPHLRRGLNRASAESAARIIYEALHLTAVAITDKSAILAHVGSGCDHHQVGRGIQTAATLQALATGEVQVAQTRSEIVCRRHDCELGSAVVAPLKHGETVIGTLKLYHDRENSISPVDVELAQGLAALFSTQLELSEVDNQARLRAQAELKALQAQVHPHFLFNALNAIVSLVRTRPENARELLVKLAEFFRCSLRRDDVISLEDELTHMDAYLAIETARFGAKLEVVREIDPATLGCLVPAFTLQPLVENAIKHGLQPKAMGGRVVVRSCRSQDGVTITVTDDGVGIPAEELSKVLLRGYGQCNGLGLAIVNERVQSLYGPECAVQIASTPGAGTEVRLRLPIKPETVGGEANVLYGTGSGR